MMPASYARSRSVPLLSGDDGTEQTIFALRSLIDDAWKDPVINRTALEILRQAGAPQYDSLAQVRAIYNWVLGNFYFINNPVMKQAIRPTRDLLDMHAGSCADMNANLLPALLGTIGYETRLVTIAADPRDPTQFSHVYAEVLLDGQWIPVDAARPGTQFGSAPPTWYRREWWSLSDSSHESYPGPGQIRALNGLRRTLGVRNLRPALGLAGYPRALGDLSDFIQQDLPALTGSVSNVLRAVNGQPVYSAVGTAVGPGGYTLPTSYAVASTPQTGASSLTPILIVGLLALGAFLVMR